MGPALHSETAPAVYMAVNTVNGKKYIGATSIGFAARKARHIGRAKRDRGCPRFYDALRKYGDEAFNWSVLRTFSSAHCAFTFERIAIAIARPEYNVTSGGFGTPGTKSKNRRKVICLEDGVVYESMTAAAEAHGLGSGDICSTCSGSQKTAKGRHFIIFEREMTVHERDTKIREMDASAAKLRRRRDLFGLKTTTRVANNGRDALGRSAAGPLKAARRVLCVDQHVEFESASAAASHFSVAKSAVIEMCLGKNGRKSVGGHKFKYMDHR